MKNQIHFRDCSYKQFCDEIAVLDLHDKSGSFKVRQKLKPYFKKLNDQRLEQFDKFCTLMYKFLVTDAETSFDVWYDKYVKLRRPIADYLYLPRDSSFEKNVFNGSKYNWASRLPKYLNYTEFYNTKKYSHQDSQYVTGLMKALFEKFHLRNSMVCPAFFDKTIRSNSVEEMWEIFMFGANTASIFNPHTYYSILTHHFSGEMLFAPVMGWNAYHIGFHNSSFKHLLTTDVIPSVVNNTKKLNELYERNTLIPHEKTVDAHCCPSESLFENLPAHYRASFDGVLFSPPYYNLEVYDSDQQSFSNYSDYSDWLESYWYETLRLCYYLMKPKAKLGFVISNYHGNDTFCDDMSDVASKIFQEEEISYIEWSSIKRSREAKKTRDGNYEKLYLFSKR